MKNSAEAKAGKALEYTVITSAKRKTEAQGSSSGSSQTQESVKRAKGKLPGEIPFCYDSG